MERPRVFRDPVHGLISFAGDVARILDTRAFQRLRRIRQDGFASLVYPGAEHSRFGHALGAYHIADRVTTRLGLDAALARDVHVAALVHDIGHGPFSHAWEVAFRGTSHEAWGARIVAEDDELAGTLAAIDPALPAAQAQFFAGTYRPRFARKLISSELDVDRMDYLLRDAHYTGVGYSAYDLDWILHALRVEPVAGGDDPDDLVIDWRRGRYAVEQVLSGRFYMYAQVYYHKTVRAAELMFTRAMERYSELARAGREPAGLPAAAALARGETVGVGDYLRLDDARVWCALDDWGRGAGDAILADLAGRLTARRLFKAIEVLGDVPHARLAEAAERVLGPAAPYYWVVDRAEPSTGRGDLHVVGHPRHGTVLLAKIADELPIAREALTVRVLAAPELMPAFQAILCGP
jgi:hypothetical protein